MGRMDLVLSVLIGEYKTRNCDGSHASVFIEILKLFTTSCE